ncbi:MAG: hypothetical protein WAW92_01165, partial [Minisyncoccia bacterium]
GDVSETKEKLLRFFEKNLKIEIHANPDFKVYEFKNMSVEDAGGIRESSEKKSFNGLMVFIVSFESISHEAQNSLLKTLEEPTPDTIFFFISPQDNLLPTLKSRMHVVKSEELKIENSFDSIFKLNLKERLERVKEIVEAISDEDSTKQEAINFVNNIESELYKAGLKENSEKLVACQNARIYLLDRGAPVKMILENLVLSI